MSASSVVPGPDGAPVTPTVEMVPHWERPLPALAPVEPSALFNGFAGTTVVASLQQLGIWDQLAEGPKTIESLELSSGAVRRRLVAMLGAMTLLGYVEIHDDRVSLTRTGRELVAQRGFFTWAVRGYGPLLRSLTALATGECTFGSDVQRDEAGVATGSGEVGRSLMRPIETDVLGSIDFASVADLGCGDGSRLIRLCAGKPDRRGVGLDISAPACELAEKRVAQAGLSDRIQISCEDVLHSMSRRTFPGIELVTSFLMMHDLFAATGNPTQVIRTLRRVFPDARYFLVADTTAQSWSDYSNGLPIFSLQFELMHTFMDTPILERHVYETAFSEAGLRLERCEQFGAPSTWLFLLSVR
ncbi:SAM-dependent methyltransferase [Micromonospora deserti]|nr:class I SAM-dependent methyltransferase [Micromonospora deserti]